MKNKYMCFVLKTHFLMEQQDTRGSLHLREGLRRRRWIWWQFQVKRLLCDGRHVTNRAAAAAATTAAATG